ncbi:inositol-tetrakisphosphate 1-kinase 3 isoform X1 [Physcomitrium patens]|uniref:ATP-grasp domain-containing protein n=2 Tax=Physcomitrium patens TaxID=3218 RepID=A0A2K1IXB4_PHYPA|nr:inositol-tetrakisphosphate 1-kinase 3-like isoform X1 [Physcomitrium patens]XP_024403884.1 inositol-tetrakisphosphate 1-kinase 3-like isoform X1 [Physcomitrium patens]XP_024403885.1 inositol-tetrakisphosphate 1-kinase 3-like isoform X1 [Physcomitrium patens]XP_024403886.1 inositol-tetrakisphosphate 1-kinase 3-like isoform X1 [Physcomitrium patens]PNR33908.1 hypothetical protein PHYPA_023724 [Physcomitrium patens]|eukprot:XP_024403882.1 inositol-tetrakisphosphate 1-kinase 3-like isoform X1 [Physcomitrella patens]
MRLDKNATSVASSASESLWGVGLLQSRERSPLSLTRIVDREREEGRRREENRRREQEREREKERKRESKVYSRDGRSQITPVMALAPPSPTFTLPPPTFSVGYALTSKKIKSFVQPKLEELARSKGISLVAIDRSIPLTEQGPFDVLLHKSTGKEWRQSLEDYKRLYPDVVVLDPPEAILQLRNRQSMLQDVAELDMSDAGGYVGVPKQLVVTGDATSIPAAVSEAGLKLPLVAKPLVADGSPKSHAMSLVYDESCLTQLDPPLVLQEFVNHGGVLFKTYVVGDYVRVVRRFSLPDVPEGEMKRNGIMPFPRVSCAAESAEEALAAGILDPQAAELPPRRLLESLSKELRRRLGLQLFNMDIIREGGAGSRYYVIDINYFPGFGKMPEYEKVFTDFLVDLAVNKSKKTSRADSSVC